MEINDQTKNVYIKIADDFSMTPGARSESDGPFPGVTFRKEFLEKFFENSSYHDYIVHVDLDGTEGYATSFLSESFEKLAVMYGKKFGAEAFKKKLIIEAKIALYHKMKSEGYIEKGLKKALSL